MFAPLLKDTKKMNLIQQFPDVSMKMQDKFKSRKKSYQWKNTNAELTFDKNLVQTKFYDNEFKKWHIKLIFIIALGVALLCFILFNVSRIIQ
jgi:hypothetical protein